MAGPYNEGNPILQCLVMMVVLAIFVSIFTLIAEALK